MGLSGVIRVILIMNEFRQYNNVIIINASTRIQSSDTF